MAEEVVCTLPTAELQEVSGDSFNKVASGPVTITFKPGYAKVSGAVKVQDVSVDFRLDPAYRKLDSRTFILGTEDPSSFYYLTFAHGTAEKDLDKADLVFKQLALKNRPVVPPEPVPGAAEADAAIQEALAHDAAMAKPQEQPGPNPLQQVGGFLSGLAQRAQQDTALLGQMAGELAKKAQQDTKSLMGQGNTKPATDA